MSKEDLNKNSEIAIKVDHVSKTFRIPHEKISSVRGVVVNAFKTGGYEEFKALDDISFEVKKGEFFGIIGRNGSGKSTLLKILAGIYQADKGKVGINGMISPFLELGIGFNPELSGRDNVYLNATVLGMTKKQIDKKFDDIVRFSELERFIDQKLKNYSSGMQVRLAFSVSIHANRDILLMDEVLAVGDSNFQSKCLREFNKYRDMGRTVIIVTHDISVVERYCNRAMLLRDGKIEMIAKADKVASKYLLDNMSDEERRARKEQKNKKDNIVSISGEKEKIEKISEIIKIEFLDKDGNVRNVFQTGDDMSVKIYFKINKNKPIFNFGISVFSVEKNYIFGTNTIFDKVDRNKILKRGYFQIDLKNILITKNSYYVRAVIAGENFKELYSNVAESNPFSVFCDHKIEGMVSMRHAWKE